MSEDLNYYTVEAPNGEEVYIENHVVNNRLVNQDRFKNGGGGKIQLKAWGLSDVYLHGNPQISFFEGGKIKKLLDSRFHTSDVTKPFKVRQDDLPVQHYENLKYNPNINVVPEIESTRRYYVPLTSKVSGFNEGVVEPDFTRFFSLSSP